jgi:hypothetical protein
VKASELMDAEVVEAWIRSSKTIYTHERESKAINQLKKYLLERHELL